MKITLVLFFFCVFQSFALNSNAQDAVIRIESETITVGDLFKQIEKQTHYLVVYSHQEVNTEKTIHVKSKSAKVSEYLKQAFSDNSIQYVFENDYIILTANKAPKPILQSALLSGTVHDKSGEPLIGVNVTIKGTTMAVTTDLDGRFSIAANKGAILAFSYIGFQPQEITLGEQQTLQIVMSENQKMLDEVVVIGYGSISKRELTSAVSHVSSKDMLSIGSGNPAMQIQGKVSGVTIDNTASADPNGWPNIQIRGASSRSAGLGPLIVIDGVPGGSLDNVNENDVESIDILKDGAASAIYGTRGSNGVIVITTKKGTNDGNVHTTYSGLVNISIPINELKVLSAKEFKERNRGDDYGADTNWFDKLTKTGVSQSHTLQISAGNAKNNYKGTIDMRDTDGIDLRSSRKEVGGRLSLNHTGKSELFNFSLNVAPRTIKYNNSDYGVFWQALSINPTIPVMDPNDPTMYYTMTGWDVYNPVETLELEESGGERKIFSWDGTLKLNLLPLLYNNPSHFLNTQITIAQQIVDTDAFFFRPSTSTRAKQSAFKGEASKNYDKSKQESLEWLVNYMFDKDNHHVKVMGGYSYQYFVNSGLSAQNKDFASDLLSYNNLGAGEYMAAAIGRTGMGSYKNDSKLIAFFGRATYNYADKYFAAFSLRHEGSSKFGDNNKWGSFPAVSGGWMISEENFLKDQQWINSLKVRADYGVTGNQNFGSYLSLITMSGYDLVYYKGQYIKGWSFYKNPNPNLKSGQPHQNNFPFIFLINRIRIFVA